MKKREFYEKNAEKTLRTRKGTPHHPRIAGKRDFPKKIVEKNNFCQKITEKIQTSSNLKIKQTSFNKREINTNFVKELRKKN